MSKGFKVSVHFPRYKIKTHVQAIVGVGLHLGLYSESLQEMKLYEIWALLYLLPLLLIALTWKEILWEIKFNGKSCRACHQAHLKLSLCRLIVVSHLSNPPMPQVASKSHVIPSATMKLIWLLCWKWCINIIKTRHF